jgi:hypothetical protein
MSTGTERTGFEPAGIEQRLKAQIDRYPVRLRPELAREAYRTHRRHRLIRRSAAAGALAVAVAAVVAVATGTVPFGSAAQRPGPVTSQVPAPGRGIVPAASFQPSPATDSLSPRQAAKDIFFVRQTTRGAHQPAGDTFFYGNHNRNVDYNADGTLAGDDMVTLVAGEEGTFSSTTTAVSYSEHTWRRFFFPDPAIKASPSWELCSVAQGGGLNNEDPTLLMKGAASLLACPELTVTRGVSIDGIAAVKISRLNNALWINAATSLPIQGETVNPKETDITQFGYLPATPADQASYLNAVIPPGFAQVKGRLAAMPRPLTSHVT